jgi:1-acyl-sn-glycerol-3-phosphate acyltransferase
VSGSSEAPVDRWGRRPTGLSKKAFLWAYHNWFRVEWEGLEHVPRRGGALLVSNHAGMLPVDGGIIAFGIEHELGRPVYSLAHHGFFRFPFIGPAVAGIGGVVGHPQNAHRLLTEDKSLVAVFPEGAKGPTKPPTERYRLQRFGRGGFVETAMRASVPIVPIALMGTEDTTPTLATFRSLGQDVPLTWNALFFGPMLGALLPFPAKVRARALPPVRFEEEAELDHYPRSLVMDRAEGIRSQLQAAINQMRQRRKNVWRG